LFFDLPAFFEGVFFCLGFAGAALPTAAALNAAPELIQSLSYNLKH